MRIPRDPLKGRPGCGVPCRVTESGCLSPVPSGCPGKGVGRLRGRVLPGPAPLTRPLRLQIQHTEDMENEIDELLQEFEEKSGRAFLHTVCFY